MMNQTLEFRPLVDYQENAKVHVIKIDTDSKTQVRILGMGIGNGSTITVMRNRSGDMVLAKNNIRISLGRSIAEKIFVEQVAE